MSVAISVLSRLVRRVVDVPLNTTLLVPVGGDTVAVSTTFCPTAAGFEDKVRVIVVTAGTPGKAGPVGVIV